MNLAFLVNDIATEGPFYATTTLGFTAQKRGHQVYVIGLGDLEYMADGKLAARALVIPPGKFQQQKKYHKYLIASSKETKKITSEELDILWLRYNHAEEHGPRSWAENIGIIFGQLAVANGVLVINNPDTLIYAINKMYFQHFPEEVRPETIITRNAEDILKFYESHKKKVVLKPLVGYGGTDVFMLKNEITNLNQIVEAINRSGYIIAQEYLPKATEGDTRLLLMNGKPIYVKGEYAAIHRYNDSDDERSNISAGGKAKKAKVTKRMLELAEIVGPKLKADGIFYAGIDMAGDKLMEINVISSGNLYSASHFAKVPFAETIIEALERKIRYREIYGNAISNQELATMD